MVFFSPPILFLFCFFTHSSSLFFFFFVSLYSSHPQLLSELFMASAGMTMQDGVLKQQQRRKRWMNVVFLDVGALVVMMTKGFGLKWFSRYYKDHIEIDFPKNGRRSCIVVAVLT